jgi:hypothetical protein
VRGCLVFIAGILLGTVLLAVAQVFFLPPGPLPQPSSSNVDLIILFRNGFLTRELQTQLAQVQSPVPLQGLIVQTEPNQNLVLAGTLSAANGALTVPARIVLRPTVIQNRVNVSVVQVQAGTLKLPGSLFSTLEGPINRQLNQALGQTSYRIVGISTTVDGLLVDVVISG